jgi:hypothetical protein
MKFTRASDKKSVRLHLIFRALNYISPLTLDNIKKLITVMAMSFIKIFFGQL